MRSPFVPMYFPARFAEPARLAWDSFKILLIWAAATGPMAILAWGVAPQLIRPDDSMPGLVFWRLVVAGMVWQLVLSLLILKLEGVPFRPYALARRLWLTTPTWRSTGKPMVLAFLLVPAFVALGFVSDDLVTRLFQATPIGLHLLEMAPAYADIRTLDVPAASGRWDILGLALVSSLFNYLLGEALLFHGVLLPRMEKAWGRWAWLGNGLLFAAYHVHKFWMLPGLVISCLCYSLPAQAFRSNWLAVLIHGLEGVVLIVAVTAVILQP